MSKRARDRGDCRGTSPRRQEDHDQIDEDGVEGVAGNIGRGTTAECEAHRQASHNGGRGEPGRDQPAASGRRHRAPPEACGRRGSISTG